MSRTLTLTAQLTDAALMTRVQAGGPNALGELYDRLALRAYRTAFAICHDRDCAQDAVQDAFLSIWSSSSTYEPSRGSVAGWAMSIVRHRAIYLTRRRSVIAERDDALAPTEEQPAKDDLPSDFAVRAEWEELAALLLRLPPAQSEVIRLGFFDGLTHEEISHRLALPPGTVKGRMRLALNKLRCELDSADHC
jgi:RNA polymerase sigma-70 factor (ECF subfamily)